MNLFLSKFTYLRQNNLCFRNVATRGEVLQSGLSTSTQVIEQQLDKCINPNFMNVEPAAVITSAFIIFYRWLCTYVLKSFIVSAVYGQTRFKKFHFRKKYMVSHSTLISISDFSDCPIKKDYIICNKNSNGVT